jgi:hypothetical protein
MVEPKKRSEPRKKKSTRRSPRANPAGQQHPSDGLGGQALRVWVDQLGAIVAKGGAIVAKGLDLTEAGLGLGVTVINRVGAAAQQQVLDRISVTAASPEAEAAEPIGGQAPGAEPGVPFGPGAPEVTAPEEQLYCITNRQPLAPGESIKISFSINNDSMMAPKKVGLRVEGFTGEVQGAQIDSGGFAVAPTRKTIAPMDFEKFVLQGTVPPEAPPDVYYGWVLVASGNELRIPVRLVVMSP